MLALGLAILVFLAVWRLTTSPDPRADTLWIASAGAAVTFALMIYTGLAVRERPEYQGRGAAHPLRALRDANSRGRPGQRRVRPCLVRERRKARSGLRMQGPSVPQLVLRDQL